jgi:hypothetical protein
MGPRERWTRRTQGLLGLTYALFCALETVAHLEAGLTGLGFWFGSLALATAGVLGGMALVDRNAVAGDILVLVGTVVGVPATAWTVLVPLLAVAVVLLTIVDVGFRVDARAAAGT